VPLHGAAHIRVHDGLVWLTVEQGAADVWLSAGRQFDLLGRGLAVLEAAQGPAEVELQMQYNWRYRLLRWLRGPGQPAVAVPAQRETMRIGKLLPHGLIRWF